MRALGFDIGEKRTGVAVGDLRRRVATPCTVVETRALIADGEAIRRLVAEYEPAVLVVGVPLSLDGTEGPQARRIRSLAARIAAHVETPVVFFDERLTSVEAGRRMREAGASERRQRGAKDMVAASIMLQAYLDARADHPTTEEE